MSSTNTTLGLAPWHVAGTYFEACNCEVICPCRSVGGRPGGRASYDACEFGLSWRIAEGRAGDLDLSGIDVVMAARYGEDEPGSPWTAALYIDEAADARQRAALSDIFLGRAGGTSFENFAKAIQFVHAVRSVRIELDHTSDAQSVRAGDYVTFRAAEPVSWDETVACAIPGFDHPGQELRADVLSVNDGPLDWEVRGRCSFATDFHYRSAEGAD